MRERVNSFLIKETDPINLSRKKMYWLANWELQRSKLASDMTGSWQENDVIRKLSFSTS